MRVGIPESQRFATIHRPDGDMIGHAEREAETWHCRLIRTPTVWDCPNGNLAFSVSQHVPDATVMMVSEPIWCEGWTVIA